MLSNIMKMSVNYGQIYRISYRCMASSQATDPIQKLFVDKIHEYNQKAKTSAEGLVDANEQVIRGLKEEMERVARTYGIKDETNIANLGLKFDSEMKLDSINMSKD